MKNPNFLSRVIVILVCLVATGCPPTSNKLPTCELTTPTNLSEFTKGETVLISVLANDPDGDISEIVISIDGKVVQTLNSQPYKYDWSTTEVEIGNHTIKAIARDDDGGEMSDECTISIVGSLPTLTTNPVTSITDNSGLCGGEVLSNGGSAITSRGICWSTTQNPTIADNLTSDGSGIGEFTSNLSDLSSNTMYYVRAYGTNSIGTSYGNEVVFISIPPGQVMDFDDNVYNTVTIGTQVWMKENLKVTHFTNGNNISHVTDKDTWIALTTDGYCWYDNDDNNKDVYGALYNWFTVNTGKLCPTGWHVASDTEWAALETYLGGSEIAGGALKESGNDHWDSPNEATNSSGFTALPGGSLGGVDGSFDYLGFNGAWWSLTESTTELAWYRWMKKQDTEIIRDDANKRYGLSVRCIKD